MRFTRFYRSATLTGHVPAGFLGMAAYVLYKVITLTKADTLTRLRGLLLLLFLTSCQSQPVKVEGWDAKQWIADADGCKGQRAQQWQQFREKRHQFLGVSENDLRELFGIPSGRELMERGQKIYRYHIVNGIKCQAPSRQLAIRVSAMHTITEIIEE